MRTDLALDQHRPSTGLVDVLDRVLDKGLLVAGDIRISLAEVELLTIRIRLIVCSIDKAQEIGMDWWRTDPHFSGSARRATADTQELKRQIRALERRLEAMTGPAPGRLAGVTPSAARRRGRRTTSR
jgi:hypothetical protein